MGLRGRCYTGRLLQKSFTTAQTRREYDDGATLLWRIAHAGKTQNGPLWIR